MHNEAFDSWWAKYKDYVGHSNLTPQEMSWEGWIAAVEYLEHKYSEVSIEAGGMSSVQTA